MCWASARAGSRTSSEALGIASMSRSEVSRICAALDTEVEAFRSRSLADEAYPYLWLDATSVKVREAGRVTSMAALVATGHVTDRRDQPYVAPDTRLPGAERTRILRLGRFLRSMRPAIPRASRSGPPLPSGPNSEATRLDAGPPRSSLSSSGRWRGLHGLRRRGWGASSNALSMAPAASRSGSRHGTR